MFFLGLISVGLVVFMFRGNIKKKYGQFREVNKLVATKYKTIGQILWISCNMIGKMYWMKFLQWANNSIEMKDNRTAIISYVLNRKLYKIAVRVKKGPNNVLLVTAVCAVS